MLFLLPPWFSDSMLCLSLLVITSSFSEPFDITLYHMVSPDFSYSFPFIRPWIFLLLGFSPPLSPFSWSTHSSPPWVFPFSLWNPFHFSFLEIDYFLLLDMLLLPHVLWIMVPPDICPPEYSPLHDTHSIHCQDITRSVLHQWQCKVPKLSMRWFVQGFYW